MGRVRVRGQVQKGPGNYMGKTTFGITVLGFLTPLESVVEEDIEPLLGSHVDLDLHDV